MRMHTCMWQQYQHVACIFKHMVARLLLWLLAYIFSQYVTYRAILMVCVQKYYTVVQYLHWFESHASLLISQ